MAFDIVRIDSDPVLSALYGALNLQSAVHYAVHSEAHKGLDAAYHFERIREAIAVREAELEAREGLLRGI